MSLRMPARTLRARWVTPAACWLPVPKCGFRSSSSTRSVTPLRRRAAPCNRQRVRRIRQLSATAKPASTSTCGLCRCVASANDLTSNLAPALVRPSRSLAAAQARLYRIERIGIADITVMPAGWASDQWRSGASRYLGREDSSLQPVPDALVPDRRMSCKPHIARDLSRNWLVCSIPNALAFSAISFVCRRRSSDRRRHRQYALGSVVYAPLGIAAAAPLFFDQARAIPCHSGMRNRSSRRRRRVKIVMAGAQRAILENASGHS